MARKRNLKRSEGPDGSQGSDDSSGGDDDSRTGDDDSRTNNEGPETTTSARNTPNSRASPSPVNASTTSAPTPTSIDPGAIVTTTGGKTLYRTTTQGRTETITLGSSQAASVSAANRGSNELSTEATAGIAVAAVILTLLTAGLLFFLFRRRRRRQSVQTKTSPTETDNTPELAGSRIDNSPRSGQQTLQSLGYGGAAELHNQDKAVETTGTPVYEMSAAPRDVDEHADEKAAQQAEQPPSYTPRAEVSQDPEIGDAANDIVSPVGDDAVTYAPGDIVSPLDSKSRY